MNQPGPRLRLPLYVNVFTVFVVITAIILGGLAWYLSRATAEAALATADQVLAEVSDKIGERTRRMLETVEALADTAVTLPSLAQKAHPPDSPLAPYLMRLLESHPALYSAILGYEDGDVVQVIAARGAELAPLLEVFGAPIGTRYLQRAVYREDGVRRQAWRFLAADGRVLGERMDPAADFDPRGRPWYRAARDGGRHTTEPYTFSSLSTLGITVSQAFDGDVPGVFGLDMTLSSLSEFLEQQEVSPSAVLAILDADGHLLAHADPDLVLVEAEEEEEGEAGGRARRRHVAELDDATLAHMLAKVQRVDPGTARNLRFEVDGRDYLGAATRLQMGPASAQALLVAAPVEDFIGPIRQIQRDGALAALAALLLSLPVIWLVSRRIAAPLSALALEAWRIRQLDLATPVQVRSFILEIDRLAASVRAMKGALAVFGRYVPRGLVEQIMAGGGTADLGGERRDVTVMFSDITGFTAQSESQPPEQLMQRTSDYFEEVTAAISGNGGVVDKYIGDAVMALWNAPRTDPDHVAKACRALLDAQARVDRFNAGLAARGEPQMPTRFGLHTGICVVGNVGSSDRMNYTAIGASVNLAARLEGLARHYGTGILVSEAVQQAVADRFLFRFIARVRPKGVSLPLAVHELLAERTPEAEARLAPMLAQWEAAQAARARGDFAAAAALFAGIAAADPADAAAAQAAAHCRELAAEPPPAGWDGVEVFNEK